LQHFISPLYYVTSFKVSFINVYFIAKVTEKEDSRYKILIINK
jgi:hypothetical protein